jgi:hypothetical protein
MKAIDPHTVFFGNAVSYSMVFDDLLRYLKDVSQFLDDTAERLKTEPRFEMDGDVEFEVLPETYEQDFRTLLSNSFLVTLVSVLEQELELFCKALAKHCPLELQWSELRGPFLDRAKAYTTKVARLPLTIDDLLSTDIQALIDIRNTIVHSSGVLDESPRSRAIIQLCKRCDSIVVEEQRIQTSMAFCKQMTDRVRQFLDAYSTTACLYFQERHNGT